MTKLGRLSKIKNTKETLQPEGTILKKTTKRQRNTLKKNKQTIMNHIITVLNNENHESSQENNEKMMTIDVYKTVYNHSS